VTHWCYDFSQAVLWLWFRLGFGLHVEGREHVPPHGPFILASNHLSFLDPPLLGAACPRRLGFMARDTLFAHGLLGAYLRSVHVMPVKRGESDIGAVREALRRLRAGETVAIFPEGGRQLSGQIGQAKRGVGLLAEAAQVPVVPVLVQGTFEALPPTTNRLARAKIRVAFGPPILYTSASAASPKDRHQQVADAVTRRWHALAVVLKPQQPTL